MKNLYKTLLMTLVFGTLAACGGGGGDGGGGGNPPPPPPPPGPVIPTDFFHYYLTSGGTQIVLIDPDNAPAPTDPKNIILSAVDNQRTYSINAFTSDPSRNNITNLYRSHVVALSAGSFYKMNTDLSGASTPTLVSSATGLTVCSDKLVTTQDTAYLFYTDSDDSCATVARTQMIELSMDNTTAPIDIPAFPLIAMYDIDANLNGWLVNDSGVLRRYDANFGSMINAGSVDASVSRAVQTGSANYMLVGLNDIYVFNRTTNTISASIYNTANSIGSVMNDGAFMYFADNGAIYRAVIGSTSTPTLRATETNSTSITFLKITGTALVYSYTNVSGSQTVTAMDLTTGALTVLEAGAAGDQVQLKGTRDGRVFYNVTNGTARRAETVLVDNTSRTTFTDALWAGAAYEDNFTITDVFKAKAMILVNSIGSGASNLNGAVLESYNASTLAKLNDIGSVPNGFTAISPADGLGDSYLFSGVREDGNGRDVLLFAPYFNGSVSRITDDAVNDTVITPLF